MKLLVTRFSKERIGATVTDGDGLEIDHLLVPCDISYESDYPPSLEPKRPKGRSEDSPNLRLLAICFEGSVTAEQ